MEVPIAIALGLMGMAGVYLVPMRLWHVCVLRRIRLPLHKSWRVLLVLAPAVLAVFVASRTMPRVFACLADGRCTATRAGGLLNLAIFGVSVALVELGWLLAAVLWSRWHSLAQMNGPSHQ